MSEPIGENSVTVMEPDDIRRALTRIAHEIVEKNQGVHDLALVGILTLRRSARPAFVGFAAPD